ncbi:prepilin-type N-terminal cleavage/methylation domain-containing protein [Sphingomonas lacunae]|uniref:Type II secretion system protein H n=1 Tax=Sphingomonas lacunae TaxID=2698828 RepID=A0A6M4AT76_9SPHN|nr:GspH/FimT family pseudopilin [Sphingomonas lacunae]QJQ32245.1 prepilin-type N-terminal cleavage/methylation domain-containing protein [Sphingomonas lacunae]
MTRPTFTVARTDRLPLTREAGFTLVELMVVLALVGLAATAVILSMPPSGGGAMGQATRFAARIAALRDTAVIDARPHGLWVTASGYGFERRSGGQWQPLEDGRLARDDWASGTAVSINGASQGRLAFDRVGLPSAPLRIDFTSGGTSASVIVSASGEVSVR